MGTSSPARRVERRRYPRYPIRWPVRFTGDVVEGYGQVVNISALGCAIASAQPVHEGDYVRLSLTLPHEDAPLEIQLAVVRWAGDGRFGMEFIKIMPEEQQRLHELIRFLQMLPKPARESEEDPTLTPPSQPSTLDRPPQ